MARPLISAARAISQAESSLSLRGIAASSFVNPAACVYCRVGTRKFDTICAKPTRLSPHLPSGRRLYSSNLHSDDAGDPDSLINSPPDLNSHYALFQKTTPEGPPPAGSFDISVPDLKREFLQLQARAHPDKYPPGIQKQKAEALSARINEAYRTLSDPLARAQYILESQYGIDTTSESGAKEHPQDPETLMEVMEVQEAIEEAADEETIAKLKDNNEEAIAACVATMRDAFNRGDAEAATKECVRLRFYYSVRNGLHNWEPGKPGITLQH
ncbi:hypothetical protein KEM55_008865 [Ascosphaera atra]|nr:hypothetical protein KEM55_008865 [Ascosphaera atra]